MRVKLSLYHLSTLEREFDLERYPWIIGRSSSADLCLNDRWASRQHCELTVEDGLLVVRDLDSTHGTLINDRPISKAVLQPGDRLGVGLSCFVVDYAVDNQSASDTLEIVCRRDGA